jgi:hypothetical protein
MTPDLHRLSSFLHLLQKLKVAKEKPYSQEVS